ncbi:MAG TPA: hypothetical protein VLA13_05500 [Massilibacterium sp.]|nr:hypothetical protein [Massilibacterium sp.]
MKFIRIDTKGEWMGTEHKSSLAGVEEHGVWEEGISCYDLEDQAEALKELLDYWTDIAMMTDAKDYANMQITIFEGEELEDQGSDWEQMAVCERTIAEIEAQPIMEKILEPYLEEQFGNISIDELEEVLNGVELV